MVGTIRLASFTYFFCVVIPLTSLSQQCYSQQHDYKYRLKVNQLDTISDEWKCYKVNVGILDTLILVKRWKPFQIDSMDYVIARKFANVAKLPYKAPDSSGMAFYNRFTQNCYVNAQELLLGYNHIDARHIFNKTTTIGIKSFKTILSRIYTLTYRFPTRPKRNLKKILPNNTLIVFRNKFGWPIHSMFHNQGIFYSKYGGMEFKEETKLCTVFKRYWDTEFIEVYQLDWDKINPFLEKL